MEGVDSAMDERQPSKPLGAAESRELLADEVRLLIAATIGTEAEPEVLADLAVQVAVVTGHLAAYAPNRGDGPTARYSDNPDLARDASALASRMPYDMIIGRANPVSPPITIEIEPPRAIGRTSFPEAFQGAPGCVHGAALAGAFDIVLTAANIIAGAAGPTVSLNITFKEPTLIGLPTMFEAWVVRTEGRRTYSRGRLIQGDATTVEAEGVFLAVGRSAVEAMHRRNAQLPSSDA